MSTRICIYACKLYTYTGIAQAEYAEPGEQSHMLHLDTYLHICVHTNIHHIHLHEWHRRNMQDYEGSRICHTYIRVHSYLHIYVCICMRIWNAYTYTHIPRNRAGAICRTSRAVAYGAFRGPLDLYWRAGWLALVSWGQSRALAESRYFRVVTTELRYNRVFTTDWRYDWVVS